MGLGDWLTKGADAINRAVNPIWWFDDPTKERPGEAPGTAHVPAPLENTLSGLAWVRDNVISRPITTAELMVDKVVGNPTGSELISGNEWQKSWNAAKHISPIQALMYKPFDERGAAARSQELENAPLEYKRPNGLPDGFDQLPWDQQQQALKEAGMPVQGNWAVQQYRNQNAWYKYGTGIGDFALSWYMDPLVLTGKVTGAIKTATITRPVSAAWNSERITAELDRNVMATTQNYMFANRDNPQLLNALPIAKNSAMGPRFGAITSRLKTPEEINLFLRVGLGDREALNALRLKNRDAGAALEADQSRLAALDLASSKYTNNPYITSLIEREMARLRGNMNANVDMVNRYNQVIDSAHLIDQIGMTRWSFAKAEAEVAAQNAYVAGAARKAGQNNLSFTAQRSIGTRNNPMARPVVDPLPGGGQVAATRVWGSTFFHTPLTVIRSFGEYRPNGHINVNNLDQDSIKELRGFVARIPNLRPMARADIVNRFTAAANEGERAAILDEVQTVALRRVAKRHGFTEDEADDLMRAHTNKLQAARARLIGDNQYSTVKMPDGSTGNPIRVDVFAAEGGGYKLHPNLVSRLMNSKQMIDLDEYEKVLARHGSAIKALRVHAIGKGVDWTEGAADYLNKLWKFGTLFRLGYIPRVLGDDLGGQMARLGAATMALRAGWGIKNAATNVARAYQRPFWEAQKSTREVGMQFADNEIAQLNVQIAGLQKMGAQYAAANARAHQVAVRRLTNAQNRHAMLTQSGTATPAQLAAAQKLVNKHLLVTAQTGLRQNLGLSVGKAQGLQDRLDRLDFLNQYKAAAQKDIDELTKRIEQPKAYQGGQDVYLPNGFVVPGAFAGQRGEMYQEMISSEASIDAIFKTNKDLLHGNLMRSWDHGAVPVNASVDPQGHMAAWLHVINAQFKNDALASRALAGDSVDEMAKWLENTGEGIAYRKRLGERLTTADDLARRAHYDVNEIAATPEIRAAALTPEGVTAEQIESQFPDVLTRPDVHRAQLAAGMAGMNDQRQGLSKIMDFWFKWAASVPADRMSRHPLFNQLYSGHAQRIASQQMGQGVRLTANDAEIIAEQARRLALRDTRKLVFDVAHSSDAGAALRFISPFFSATTEAWQRWARIIAEKPEVAGYAAKFLNAPMAMGVVQDADGNKVDSEGYSYDPVTKKRVLVPKGDRRIVMRLPKFMVQGHNPVALALGASEAGDINLSQDSMNLVLQGDPWFNPGQGPIVTIPVSKFVEDKPQLAEMARALGVLPFGPSTSSSFGGNPLGTVADMALPRTVKNFLTAYDTSDERYQQVKAQIMQRAAFEHATMGKVMPSAQEIADRTRNYWLFAATSAFLGPVASQTKDPYQFYRDEYNKMSRMVAETSQKDEFGRPIGPSADDMFLEKYGESYFVFAQAMSKNLTGRAATMNAVKLSEQYKDLIAKNPELAALVVGPEGNGPFSPEAYAYQLNTPLVPGGAEMMRTRLTADEAMKENERRLGWAKYTGRMNQLNAELVSRGLTAFTDSGAEDLLEDKRAFTNMYSQPVYPNGEANPYYIKAWAEDFNTLDRNKYNAMIPGLTELARSPLADREARSDLRVLQEYLGARAEVTRELAERKENGGSDTLRAKANSDLASQWMRTVQNLVLSNTSFGDLYHRYLSRDLEVDVVGMLEAEEIANGG